ncbi:aminotransferase class I/II-fold pyridoxal phosphate-dependent enzyme [Pedobacter sp. MC2016-14]|uniref:trans-sulfuration enzyme family protein n=1 Tax=Pedobacter sp. MC2016-14 TaxID=2897327 RepID=UPI001E484B05|nr:aminotransferase class I/II-fold pyridoxal phosphate-dependent enzyme [Pedobacter sp. MC2016-14]MCD0489400.1 aminotransferase class I/II-fold pyridoxal phosphate-dependent enzyme [Pedobacter sp. MC2016-14]
MQEDNFETIAIRLQAERSQHKEHSVPLYLTSSYKFDDAEEMRALFANEKEGNVYSRYANPNTSELIEKMAALEGAEDGWATATGMAAIFTTFAAFLGNGDHVLSSRSVFGSTHQLLSAVFPKWGITYSYADLDKQEQWIEGIKPNTKMIFVETPSNPGIDIIDLEWLAKLAKQHNLLLVVDNCFATPYLQQPIKLGADISIHSATKFIDGQGRTLGGIILGTNKLMRIIEGFARHSGPAMSPFNAWLMSKSLETLAVRMDRHCDNALKVAEFLESHAKIKKVMYPFLPSHPQYAIAKKQMKQGGGIVTLVIDGGVAAAGAFMNKLKMFSISANLGDTRSIATHPATSTHSKLTEEERLQVGIEQGTIRLSIGLEHIDDILRDISQALD